MLRRKTTQEFGFPSMLTMSEEEKKGKNPKSRHRRQRLRPQLSLFSKPSQDGETDCKTQKVVVKGEKADPVAVLERVQKNSDRNVELPSPIPKPPTEDPKKPGEKAAVENLPKKKDEVDGEQYSLRHRRCSGPKVKCMQFGDFISCQRNVILRPKTNVGLMNLKGEETIAEERACCILCFAKLAEGDELLKSVCGCTNAPVHVTCTDTGIRKEGNICNYCRQEVHNEAVTLHRVITTAQGVNTVKKRKWAFFTHAR